MKTILVTGATSGFGKAIAETFASKGYRIIITGRRTERLENFKRELEKKFNTPVLSLCFDVRKLNEVEKNLENLPADFRKIDVLINNAGLALGISSIEEGNTNDWETMIDTNIKGLLYVTRTIAPMMKENKSGHIFNIGSIAGKETYRNGNVYCATKHAVDSITKATRIDLLPYGIKVTGICPGAAETEFSLVRYKGDEDRAKNVYNGFSPLVAEDVAEIVWFAASRPGHVCMNDIVITPTAQANAFYTEKKTE